MKIITPIFAMIVFALSGCMSQVQTSVDAYSAIPEDLSPKTVYIAPYQKSERNSLEWRANAQKLAGLLREKGYASVPRQRDAKLVAYFGFAVDQGKEVQRNYSIPQYGVTGYSSAQTYGTVYGNSVSATTTYTPTYGVTGYSTGTSTQTVFTRSVSIDMIERGSGKKMFEAKAVSRGSCNSFAPVADPILQAIFTNFPKGKTGTVTLPYQADC